MANAHGIPIRSLSLLIVVIVVVLLLLLVVVPVLVYRKKDTCKTATRSDMTC